MIRLTSEVMMCATESRYPSKKAAFSQIIYIFVQAVESLRRQLQLNQLRSKMQVKSRDGTEVVQNRLKTYKDELKKAFKEQNGEK